MKNLDKYIQEKFLIGDDVKLECPKNKNELRKILKERLAKDKNADLNDIDVSQITDMGPIKTLNSYGEIHTYLFQDLDPHNIDISQWDVSNVTNMECLFYGCENFDCDLSNWNVKNVENTSFMFGRCENFKGNGLEKWKFLKLNNSRSMFSGCKNFDCNLSNWDMSNVTDMHQMFFKCKKFKGIGLNKWKVSNNLIYKHIFYECDSLINKPSWYKE